jgi:hypothetical protein
MKLVDFWKCAIGQNKYSPKGTFYFPSVTRSFSTEIHACMLDAFIATKSLRLVGPFDYLDAKRLGTIKPEQNYYLLSARFSTDLPEMQTLAICDDCRFTYWR